MSYYPPALQAQIDIQATVYSSDEAAYTAAIEAYQLSGK